MELRILKILTCIFLCFSNLVYAEPTKLAFVNKSFNRDLKVSLRLYESYEKFVKPTPPFYVVMPEKEKSLFFKYFTEAKDKKQINHLPVFLTEQEVFKRCGKDVYTKSMKMRGWQQQQVVKLCFGKLGIADNYLTIDSDTYFTRPFDTNILFHNGQARTYAPSIIKKNNKHQASTDKMFSEFTQINMFLTGKSEDYNNFILGFGMWSSEMIKELDGFIYHKKQYNFADLINLVPLEMQWYGVFVYTHHLQKFFKLPELFSLIGHNDIEHNKKRCIPTKGYPGHYGISYQESLDKKYINPCNSFKTQMRVSIKSVQQWFKELKSRLFY